MMKTLALSAALAASLFSFDAFAAPIPVQPAAIGELVELAQAPRAYRPARRPVARPPHARPPIARPPHARPPHARPPLARPPYARPPAYRPGRPWVRNYYWRPGGAIAAGVAIGVLGAAAAAAYAGAPPQPGLCWYYTDELRRNGFWDVCPD